MFEETMTQEASAEGFAEEFSFEAEEQPEDREASETPAQEESPADESSQEQASPEEATTEESAPNTEGEKPEENQNDENADGIEIVYMGEKKMLTREEAKDLAEKGMNLDRIRSQLNDTRAEVARLEAELRAPKAGETLLPLFKAYAKVSGGTLQDLTASMMEAVRTAGIAIEKPQESNYFREKAVKDWQAFFTAYPDIRDPKTDLPQEVWDAINSGLTPRAAYIEHRQRDFEGKMAEKDSAIAQKDEEIAQLQQQIKTLQLNAENKKKSVGGLTSSVETDTRSDFEKAFQF